MYERREDETSIWANFWRKGRRISRRTRLEEVGGIARWLCRCRVRGHLAGRAGLSCESGAARQSINHGCAMSKICAFIGRKVGQMLRYVIADDVL